MPRLTPRFQSLPAWPDPPDPSPTSARFKVDDARLWRDLSEEIRRLQTEDNPDEYIVQLVVDPGDVRVDGTGLKANHRIRYHGVVVSFESRYGPLRFAADHYNSWWRREAWRANIRAITAHLEAARLMERHGVAKSGQQYTGWKALGAGDATARPMAGSMTIVEAMSILEAAAGVNEWFDPRVERLTRDGVTAIYKAAAKRSHPDGGGTAAAFQTVQVARDVLLRNAR